MNARFPTGRALRLFALALALVLVPLGAWARVAAAAPALAKPAQLGLCVACHSENGTSRVPGTPHIGGQDELYLRNSLLAYRKGDRKSSAMNAISNALQPRDIDDLARWYARQPGFVPARQR